jgi:transcriptional regulator with XRE-family HTH domain
MVVQEMHRCHNHGVTTTDEEHEAGAAVGRLAAERGISISRLAELSGVDRSALSRIINGKRNMRAGELQALARALGVSAADILPATEMQQPAAKHTNTSGLLTLEEFMVAAKDDLTPRRARLLGKLKTRIDRGLTWGEWWQTIEEIEKVFAAVPGLQRGGDGGPDQG